MRVCTHRPAWLSSPASPWPASGERVQGQEGYGLVRTRRHPHAPQERPKDQGHTGLSMPVQSQLSRAFLPAPKQTVFQVRIPVT